MAEEDAVPLIRWYVGVMEHVAVSYDGAQVVSTDESYFRVWDVRTGVLIFRSRTGHTGPVWSVASSPDGTCVAGGSDRRIIRIWDARTGAPVGKPLKGHTDRVCAVAFSPDSTRIVSGSQDHTIRIWDARTHAPIGEPLIGHTTYVNSVAFSPGSAYVVSGSDDCTIRIWDVRTCAPVGEPLIGHTAHVNSVAFSPNSTYIVSGSDDCTIRIWDVRTCAPVGEPLIGHTAHVNSVAFFPDGRRVVSGSYDCTICIWDVCTGTLVGEPLAAHANSVNLVAVSSEGTHIISGSKDGKICVWEAPQSIPPPDAITQQNTPPFDMVTSRMSTREMFDCLVTHGCTDLTASMDTHGYSSLVIASGGFGDVRRVTRDDGTSVAVKTLRLHILLKGDDKGVKRAVREVYIWSKLRHPNVQELLGIVVFRGELGMISPWMEQGNLQQYIIAHPDIERYPLCIQVASGVSYLHGIDMIHGDLKANNVLVSDDGTLKINDFDHAILSDTTLRFSTTTRPGGGTLRWMAPELYEADDEENGENKPQAARTKKTDIYALGMTILEIYTGNVPFAECRTDAGICKAIIQKRIPRRPSELSGPEKQMRRLWQLLEKCWDYDPATRPNALSVLKHLHRYST